MIPALLLALAIPSRAAEPAADLRRSVVKIFVTAQKPNYYQPWQMLQQENRSGSGAVIEGERILTNAHVIGDQIYIKVRKAGESKLYKAKVEFAAHDSDLALLKVDDPAFFSGSPPLPLGELPKQSDKVATYGFPMGGDELSITEGTVSRIEVHPYSHSAHRLLTIQTDAAINPGNSGGPSIKDGKIIGVAFQTVNTARTSNIGYLIPVTMVRRFLKDVADGTYDGIPTLGTATQRLDNNAVRARHKVPEGKSGMLVTKVDKGSSAEGVLRTGDVITAIDGALIANDRTYKLGGDNRVSYVDLVATRQLGEKLPVEVLREGKPLSLSIPLKKTPHLVEPYQYDKKPSYFIFGGLVFTELNWNFIDLWPSSHQPTLFRYLGEFGETTPERGALVVLSSVLPDEVNEGYHESAGLIVDTINGRKIGSLRNVPEAFKHPQSGYDVILGDEESSNNEEVVLDAAKAEQAGPAILERQNIAYDRSADLRQSQSAHDTADTSAHSGQ